MIVYGYIVIAFTASELCLLAFKRSKTGLKYNKADKRSLLYLWITIPACLTLAGFISGYRLGPAITGDAVTEIALAIAIVGFAIR